MNKPLWFIIAIGAAIRLLIASFTIGSNDALFWEPIANTIQENGFLHAYENLGTFKNHPPLAGCLFVLSSMIASLLEANFLTVFKGIGIIGELISCWILSAIWEQKQQGKLGLIAAAIFAFAPVSVLIGSYHGNTDPIYTCLILSSLFCIHNKKSISSGLLFAAAINIKLIVLVLGPLFFLEAHKNKNLKSWLLGFSFSALPFLILLFWGGLNPLIGIFTYRPTVAYWGVSSLLILSYFPTPPKASDLVPQSILIFRELSPYLILLTAIFISWKNYLLRKSKLFLAAALCYTILLILAPGFGLQYFSLLIPLILCTSIRWGFLCAVAASVVCMYAYYHSLTGGKFFSHNPPLIDLSFYTAQLLWVILIYFFFSSLRSFRKNS